MSTQRLRRLLPPVTLLVMGALAACGGGDDSASPDPPSSTTSTSAATSTTTVEESVIAAYGAFWDGYLKAADPMNPEHPVLAEVATGEQLRQLRSAFLARLSAGEVIRGGLDKAPDVVEVSGDTATVSDCYLDRTGIYDSKTGQRKDTETGVRHLVTVRLVREASVWKVTSLTREGDGCTPGNAS